MKMMWCSTIQFAKIANELFLDDDITNALFGYFPVYMMIYWHLIK